MAATFVEREGAYGQVEANRLTGITFGNIEAQAPAFEDATGETPIAQLENGQFLCVVVEDVEGTSPMGRVAVPPGQAPNATPFLVYSEKKLYDERHGYSDFVDRAREKVDGKLYPRLIGITPDTDIFTTNTIDAEPESLELGDILYIGDDGYLTTTAGANQIYQFTVTKVYTLPDGQPAVKLVSQRYVA